MLETDNNPFGSRFREMMAPQEEGRLVIGEWEAEAYADMRIEDFRTLAKSFGFDTGGNPVTDQALQDLRTMFRADINERYIVLQDT